jgi:hypothetical protein
MRKTGPIRICCARRVSKQVEIGCWDFEEVPLKQVGSDVIFLLRELVGLKGRLLCLREWGLLVDPNLDCQSLPSAPTMKLRESYSFHQFRRAKLTL